MTTATINHRAWTDLWNLYTTRTAEYLSGLFLDQHGVVVDKWEIVADSGEQNVVVLLSGKRMFRIDSRVESAYLRFKLTEIVE